MSNQLVQLPHVTQEPIIAYDMLAAIGDKVKTEIASLNINSIEATEENLSTIKKLRAELNNNFKELEERRKFIKATVLKPYDDFDENYRKLIAIEFQNADSLLKEKSSLVETGILVNKTNNLKLYFSEKSQFDFVKFEDLGLKITKSLSDKSIQIEIDRKLKQIEDELSTIETLDNKDRVLAKYHISKDLNASISSVNIEVKKEQEIKALEEAKKTEVITEPVKVETPVVKEVLTTEANEKIQEKHDDTIYKMTFSVLGTKKQLKAIKAFLEQEGIQYE